MFNRFFPVLCWLYRQVTIQRCFTVVRFGMEVSLVMFRLIFLLFATIVTLYSLFAGLVMGGLAGAVLTLLPLAIGHAALYSTFPRFFSAATDSPVKFMDTRMAERIEYQLAGKCYRFSSLAFMWGCDTLSDVDQHLRHLHTWWFLTRLKIRRHFWSAWYRRPLVPTMSLVTAILMLAVTPIAAVASPIWMVVWPSLAIALLVVDTWSAHKKLRARLRDELGYDL